MTFAPLFAPKNHQVTSRNARRRAARRRSKSRDVVARPGRFRWWTRWDDLFGPIFLVENVWKMYGKCMENHKGVNYKTHFLFGKCVWGKGHEMLITADRCVINHLNLQNMTGSL